jgi:hypothetical protein
MFYRRAKRPRVEKLAKQFLLLSPLKLIAFSVESPKENGGEGGEEKSRVQLMLC